MRINKYSNHIIYFDQPDYYTSNFWHLIQFLHFLGFYATFNDPHNQGNFGPFQICYDFGISVCGGYPGGFQTRGK